MNLEFLDCPVCGDPCEAILSNRPTAIHPYPWWEDGQDGVCRCGALLEVNADGERAWLVDVSEEVG